ncbi:hypothetical protein Hanom_Chr06g00509091 [Helianthus anomalus]
MRDPSRLYDSLIVPSIIRLSSPSLIFIHILGFLQLHSHLSFSSNRIHENHVLPQGQPKSILPIICPNSLCCPSPLRNLHHKGTIPSLWQGVVLRGETMVEKTKGMKEEVVMREYTINLHNRLHGCFDSLKLLLIRRSRFLCLNNIHWIS